MILIKILYKQYVLVLLKYRVSEKYDPSIVGHTFTHYKTIIQVTQQIFLKTRLSPLRNAFANSLTGHPFFRTPI